MKIAYAKLKKVLLASRKLAALVAAAMIAPMQRPNRTQILIILTLLVALWLRVHRLIDLPPGLHYDEAANGILSGDIGLRGARPIFITSYTGKETLFFYVAGFLMRLVGESIFTLRLASAFLGVLTVAMSVWLGKEIGRKLGSNNGSFPIPNPQFPIHHFLPLILAILLTTHFPHLIFSRLGFRAIAQPLLQGLTVAATLRGLRTRKWGSFVAAGVFLGLTGYTYLAARLFPILFGLFMLPLLGKWWRQLGVMLAAATVTFAPLGLFFVQNPETFWVRIGQVGGGGTTLGDYANSFWRSLQMLGMNGDPYWRFNIPDRPLFEPVWFVLWAIGMGLLVLRLRKALAETWALVLLLLATPLVMILPTALALDEIVPSNLRAIGLYPFVLVPIALALVMIAQRLPKALQMGIAPVVLGATLLLGAGTYFDAWGTRADTFYESDADLIALAAYLDEHAAQYDEVYVGSLHYRHPTVAFASETYDRVKWLVGSDAVVLPADGKRGLLAFPQSSPPPDWLLAFTPLDAPLGPDGRVLFWAWDSAEIAPPSSPGQIMPTVTNFANLIQLDGYELLNANTIKPALRLHWTILGTPERHFAPFVHVEDDTGHRWVQAETVSYASEQWRSGEQVVQEVALPLPAGMPANQYRFVVGLFADTDRLSLIDTAGKFAGNTIQLVGSLAGNGATPQVVRGVPVGFVPFDGVELASVEAASSAESGATTIVVLNWRFTQQPPRDTFSLGFQNAPTPALEFKLPASETVPFYATQRVLLPVPDEVDGVSELTISAENQTASLAQLTITAVDRLFARPAYETATEASFEELIQLAGYTLNRSTDNQLDLKLVWQASSDISADYTVFVQVLNPDGTCCIWQQDVQPQQGSYPTSRWVTGEFIVDAYAIEFAGDSGVEYPILVGLYRAENGQRLQVIGGEDHLSLDPIQR